MPAPRTATRRTSAGVKDRGTDHRKKNQGSGEAVPEHRTAVQRGGHRPATRLMSLPWVQFADRSAARLAETDAQRRDSGRLRGALVEVARRRVPATLGYRSHEGRSDQSELRRSRSRRESSGVVQVTQNHSRTD